MNQYSGFFSALKKVPGLSKEQAVYDFSQGRTRSLRDLDGWEVQELTRRLRGLTGPPLTPPEGMGSCPVDEKKKKMIGKLFYLGHEMRLIDLTWKTGEANKDYTRFHDFIEKYGYLKKPINSYTFEELPKLVSQVEAIYRSFLQKS